MGGPYICVYREGSTAPPRYGPIESRTSRVNSSSAISPDANRALRKSFKSSYPMARASALLISTGGIPASDTRSRNILASGRFSLMKSATAVKRLLISKVVRL